MAKPQDPDRRRVLVTAVALAALPAVPGAASATPEQAAAAMAEALGGKQPRPGKVKLDIPALAENGNSIQLTVTVDSPMTAAEHVKAIYIFSEKNPLPDVARFHLGPRAGRAKVATSIRLATSQKVTAVAALSDGSLWSDEKEVIVTLAACLEAG